MSSVSAPSRAVLSRWMTDVAGVPVSGKPEKLCSNGALFCQLLEAVAPGSLNLQKVNQTANAEHQSLANYRILQSGLDKAGVTAPIDSSLLCKGQPQATLDLLNRLFALSGQPAGKGLAPLDANAVVEGDRPPNRTPR